MIFTLNQQVETDEINVAVGQATIDQIDSEFHLKWKMVLQYDPKVYSFHKKALALIIPIYFII